VASLVIRETQEKIRLSEDNGCMDSRTKDTSVKCFSFVVMETFDVRGTKWLMDGSGQTSDRGNIF
jgi:hypothetical protein